MSADEALSRLHAILAQPDYQLERSRSWWDRLWQPVGELISSLLVQLLGLVRDAASGQSGALGVIAVIASGVLILAAAVYLAATVRLGVTREARLRAHTQHPRRLRSDTLYSEAQRLADAGQLGEAARAAYLSALYALDERALLQVQSGLTNRELAGELASHHPGLELGHTFAALVQRYDRVRYGRPAVTPAAFDELRGLVDRARSLAT